MFVFIVKFKKKKKKKKKKMGNKNSVKATWCHANLQSQWAVKYRSRSNTDTAVFVIPKCKLIPSTCMITVAFIALWKCTWTLGSKLVLMQGWTGRQMNRRKTGSLYCSMFKAGTAKINLTFRGWDYEGVLLVSKPVKFCLSVFSCIWVTKRKYQPLKNYSELQQKIFYICFSFTW